jgi:hypothetical protein
LSEQDHVLQYTATMLYNSCYVLMLLPNCHTDLESILHH